MAGSRRRAAARGVVLSLVGVLPAMGATAASAAWLGGCSAATPERAAAPERITSSSTAAEAPPRAPLSSGSAASDPPPSSPVPRKPAVPAIVDDISEATRQALRAGKLLLVEAWAPWCHTCLSMKHHVLPDPALAPLGEQVVFATLDTDRAAAAPFLERHVVEVWPTVFVIDPATDRVLGLWQGAATVDELRGLVADAVAARAAAGEPDPAAASFVTAKAAQARGAHAEAQQAFRRAVEQGGTRWRRRSEALAGWLASTYRLEQWTACAELGVAQVGAVGGTALPTDFCWVLLACADKVKDQRLRQRAREAALSRLKKHTQSPPPGASVDDRADALGLLGQLEDKLGHTEASRQAIGGQLALLEEAAKAAPSPAAAATYDYARLTAYFALGQGDRAVAMLEQRVAQLPDAYEPHARLAEARMKLGRWAEALPAVDGAIARAYGPRALRYRHMRAEILGQLGRKDAQREALQAVLDGFGALPAAQRRGKRVQKLVEQARKELVELERE